MRDNKLTLLLLLLLQKKVLIIHSITLIKRKLFINTVLQRFIIEHNKFVDETYIFINNTIKKYIKYGKFIIY